jgi:transposase InsO family protein
VQSKQPQKPHKAAEERHLPPLELIYSDICEKNSVLTEGEQRYFMTMIDDVSRYCYETNKAEVENPLEKKIKRFRSDCDGEYFFNEFDLFCTEHGIIHEMTLPHSPQSNGVAKRKNHTLTDLVNSILDTAGLSKAWWGGFIDFISCSK